ncbi:MAG TPA: DNA-formamidopyrimidine glycosylase family protein [Actinomycetota bacterium]|nr:DNA-formamidopyrimidine glycosylase family protein [Actinomycetota bacterium]
MPELPEMQALAERLAESYANQILSRVDLMQFSALKTVSPGLGDLGGQNLESVGRRAKYLLFELEAARLIVHLSQGGRIDFEAPAKRTKPKGSVARLVFGSGDAFLIKEYGTERKAALWVVEPAGLGPLEGLGPEPFDVEFEDLMLNSEDRRRVHTLLRDQRFVAGIGRGFSDDVLHHARLSPFDSLASLDRDRRYDLISSIRTVLTEATERERERTGGLPAKMGDRFTIHNRHGQACPRCGETLHRISYESHEVTYCPNCQTGGKVLADRRLSRLLK